LVLNNKVIYLRNNGDTNHYIKYDINYDGPLIVGFNGGAIGASAVSNLQMMTWNTTQINMNVPLLLNNYNVNLYLSSLSGIINNNINNLYNYIWYIMVRL
jgi:hypothetical protein